jgi:hypothetical protein
MCCAALLPHAFRPSRFSVFSYGSVDFVDFAACQNGTVSPQLRVKPASFPAFR